MKEDADSIFGEKRKPVGSAPATATEQPTEPLIIRDNKENEDAAVADLPSVSHLPDPKDGKAPETPAHVEKK
jgi:hypothetical protein